MEIILKVQADEAIISAINNLAGAIAGLSFSPPTPAPERKTKKEKVTITQQHDQEANENPVPTTTAAPEPPTSTAAPEPEPPTSTAIQSEITIEQLREIANKANLQGKSKDVKAIIEGYGVQTFTQVPKTLYPDMMEKLQELIAGCAA